MIHPCPSAPWIPWSLPWLQLLSSPATKTVDCKTTFPLPLHAWRHLLVPHGMRDGLMSFSSLGPKCPPQGCHLNGLMRIVPAEWNIPSCCPSHWGTPSLILQIHKLGTPIIFIALINQHSLVINKCYTPCCNHFLNGIASINRGRQLASLFLNVWTIRGMILQVPPSDHWIPCSISWYFVPSYWVTFHCLMFFFLNRHVHRHFPLRPRWITCSKPM